MAWARVKIFTGNQFFCLRVELCIISVVLSKEKVNLLISDSVSSPRLNYKHLANVTEQAVAGDQVVYPMAIHNNV